MALLLSRVPVAALSVVLACLASLPAAMAQELEVRLWSHLPNEMNFATAAYVDTHADIAFDPALQISDATLKMTTYLAAYMRTFSVLGRSARLDVRQPWKQATWTGTLAGAPASVERDGWGDSTIRLSVHLLGAPPLEGAAYAAYRAAAADETLVGVALGIDLPTGEYMSDKLLNIGSNRFTFRPQLGIVRNIGRLSLEATAMAALFTDNNDFFNGGTFKQEPIYSLQGHATYTLPDGLWLSAGAAGATGGQTTVNDAAKNDARDTLYYGISAGYPVMPWLGAKLGYVATRRQSATGSDTDSLIVSLSTFW
jgi:hypothetical protein